MRITKLIIAALVGVIAWLALVAYAGFNGVWMSAVAADDDSQAFLEYAVRTLEEANAGSSAPVLIEAGEVIAQFHASPDDSVDANTVFAAASMSKWFAATAMMQLVEEGRAELDVPVSRYLSRWQLPDSAFDNDGVTIRRLLSHTAGFVDELGFGDYAADETLPSLEQALTSPRSSSGARVEIGVTVEPGSEWRYSGGSYLLLELLIEEISGRSFEDYVQDAVFEPLSMSRSSYDYIDSYANSAGSYALDGARAPSYEYASSAATGLVVSSDDLTGFVLSQTASANRSSVLGAEAIRSMRQPHGKSSGFDIWGLGTILYAPTAGGDFIFGHDGADDPAINTAARINPDTGDALIVLVTGHPSIATSIGSEWVLWQTGYPGVFATDAVFESMVLPGVAGSVLIVLLAWAFGVGRRGGGEKGPS